MHGCVPRALYLASFFCFFLCSLQSSAQSQDPKPDPNAAAPASPVLDANDDSDSPDVPVFLKGLVNTEQYLKLRNEHIRRLRGLADSDFHPARRNGAIRRMR